MCATFLYSPNLSNCVNSDYLFSFRVLYTSLIIFVVIAFPKQKKLRVLQCVCVKTKNIRDEINVLQYVGTSSWLRVGFRNRIDLKP